MRGDSIEPDAMFSYISAAQRVPQDHPLRAIRRMVDEVLRALSPRFDKLYSRIGRPSIPPERLLRALLLQVLRCSTRSAASGCLWSSSTTTCFSAGLWA
jgi:transposase